MKYILLYNPISGKKKFKKDIPLLVNEFKRRELHLDVYESKCEKDLETKACEVASFYDVVIAAGGDGTINEVINGIMKSDIKPKLAVYPAGTANDISNILGMPKKMNKWLKMFFSSKSKLVDVNKINDRYFLYATGAGLLTSVSYDTPRDSINKLGYIAYLIYGIKDFFKPHKMSLRIVYDEGEVEGDYMLMLGLSAKRVAGVSLARFSNGKLNDGKLEIRLIRHSKFAKLLKMFIFLLTLGRKFKRDIHLQSSKYTIYSDDKIDWNTDGEVIESKVAKIEVINEAFYIFASDKSRKKYF